MDYPTTVRSVNGVAAVSVFSAMIVGSNFVLVDFPNVKLLDTLVFVSAFLFGFRIGAATAVVSELVWSFVSPWGIAGAITPFLTIGELLFAAAGWAASNSWRNDGRVLSRRNVFFGSVLAISAFMWDLETNVGTALIAFWPNVTIDKIVLTEFYGMPFMLSHEISDFLLGTFFAPLIILLVPRFIKESTGSLGRFAH